MAVSACLPGCMGRQRCVLLDDAIAPLADPIVMLGAGDKGCII